MKNLFNTQKGITDRFKIDSIQVRSAQFLSLSHCHQDAMKWIDPS